MRGYAVVWLILGNDVQPRFRIDHHGAGPDQGFPIQEPVWWHIKLLPEYPEFFVEDGLRDGSWTSSFRAIARTSAGCRQTRWLRRTDSCRGINARELRCGFAAGLIHKIIHLILRHASASPLSFASELRKAPLRKKSANGFGGQVVHAPSLIDGACLYPFQEFVRNVTFAAMLPLAEIISRTVSCRGDGVNPPNGAASSRYSG